MPQFKPSNWYWVVAGATDKVWSSATGDYVPVSNVAYQQWLSTVIETRPDGKKIFNKPTKIDIEQNLGRSLAQHEDVITRPITPGVLDGLKNAKSDYATEVYKVLMATNNLNWENRIRACERAAGISTAPDLTNQQLKQLLKSLA